MTDTTFIDKSTVIEADWLQDVNNLLYRGQVPAPSGAITVGLIVNSIAALRAQSKLLASQVFVTGYYAAGDGGGGHYWYDSSDTTSVDNSGTIIVAADGGRWKLSYTDTISVRQFGAKGDGTTDDTAAFNAATQSTATYAAALAYNITVPSGSRSRYNYKLSGSVYVRKGQTLRGDGLAACIDASSNTTTNVFILGKGLIAGVPTDDSGGAPVKIDNFFILGGAANSGVVQTNAQGFTISNLFLSAVGIGLDISGADGLISGIEIDQALIGMYFTGAQNISVTNFNIYLPNYAVQINSDCRDLTFSTGIIEYPQYTGLFFASGTSNIQGVNVSNVNFTMNVQYGTFLGYIFSSAANVQAQFAGCSFRNWPGYAVGHTTGISSYLTFSGCTFDALRTTTAYAQSTTAKVLQTVSAGGDGNYAFYGCEFKNLLGEIAQINDGVTKLTFVGGRVVGCDANATSQKRFNVVTTLVPNITVKGVVGFPYVFLSGGNQCANLPWWGASTAWRVAIRGNKQNVGDSNYSAMDESVYTVTWQNNAGTKSIYADKANLWQTPNRTNPGQLAPTVCLGTAAGGAASTTTFAATGSINIAVAITNAANFDFFAETAT